MSFKEMVMDDNHNVFSNIDEFASKRTVVYDEETYRNVPCTISKLKAKDRVITQTDHVQGIFLVTSTVHFPLDALGGNIPEKGSKIQISDETGFLRGYYVAQSGCDLGMVRLELEGYDE